MFWYNVLNFIFEVFVFESLLKFFFYKFKVNISSGILVILWFKMFGVFVIVYV